MSMTKNEPRDKAAALLEHYFSMLAEKCGMRVQSREIGPEMQQIVELIMEAAYIEMKERLINDIRSRRLG